MYDLYSNKVQEPVDKLRGQLSQQVLVHASEARPLDVLIQVHAQELKHDDVVAAEVEAVEHLDDAILVRIFAKDTVEESSLDTGIVRVLLPVLADLDSDDAPAVLHVNAADDLAERTRVDDLFDEVTVADLLADVRVVEAVPIRNLAHTLYADTSNCVDGLVGGELGHLEGRQLTLVLLQGLHRREAL